DAGFDAGHDAGADAGQDAVQDAAVPPAFAADGGAPLPGPPSPKCSTSGSPAMSVTFDDNGASPIEVWWVDFQCREEFYFTILPGMARQQGTYESHPWRIRAPGTHALLKEVPVRTSAAPLTVSYP